MFAQGQITSWWMQACSQKEREHYLSRRIGESKVGEHLQYLSTTEVASPKAFSKALQAVQSSGVRYVILGIPEDIGPRANHGRGGSQEAMSAFMGSFLNIQSNQFLDPSAICIAGSVLMHDLQTRSQYLTQKKPRECEELRVLVEEIDSRVCEVLQHVYEAGLIPIIIGGGHNNVYPIQKALSMNGSKAPLACINIDPHADLRRIEGRHSGNGFTYSLENASLSFYYVLGLHESYNSNELFSTMTKYGVEYRSYDDIKLRKKWSLEDSLQDSLLKASAVHSNVQLGIDVDLDSIAGLPVSAETPLGFTLEEVAAAVYVLASSNLQVRYLHLPEGAPSLHSCHETGRRYIGRALSTLVTAFIKGREENV